MCVLCVVCVCVSVLVSVSVSVIVSVSVSVCVCARCDVTRRLSQQEVLETSEAKSKSPNSAAKRPWSSNILHVLDMLPPSQNLWKPEIA